MALSTTINLGVQANLSTALDLKTALSNLALQQTFSLATGTGAGQADQIFDDSRTLSSGANEDLDLAGVLVNALGTTVTLVKLKCLIFIADSANTTNLTIGPKSSNGLVFLGGTTPTFVLAPGGLFVLFNPSSAAITVTAGTGDLINVANAAGASATYKVIAIGTTA